ncbi:MAG: hypothetical protein PUB54_08805 [Lachnospiraceae bacterium]|nr:hypothetical protein [Lachnospiraceae bacterium]
MKEVSKQIQKNPNVEISCFDGNNRLCLAGRLVRDERKEAKKHMLDNYPHLRAMYSEEDDNTEVLYFEDATATFSSFSEAPRTINF